MPYSVRIVFRHIQWGETLRVQCDLEKNFWENFWVTNHTDLKYTYCSIRNWRSYDWIFSLFCRIRKYSCEYSLTAVWHFCFWMFLVSGWCWRRVGVSLTWRTSRLNVTSIEHTITSFFVAFWLVLPFRERNYFLKNKTFYCIVFTNFPHKKYILFKISASYLFLHFLKNSQISASMFWQNIFLFKKC